MRPSSKKGERSFSIEVQESGWFFRVIVCLALVAIITLSSIVLSKVDHDGNNPTPPTPTPTPTVSPSSNVVVRSSDRYNPSSLAPDDSEDTTFLCCREKTIQSFGCRRDSSSPCLVPFEDVEVGAGINRTSQTVFTVHTRGSYDIVADVVATIRCPVRRITVQVWELTDQVVVAEVSVNGIFPSLINTSRVFLEGQKIAFVVSSDIKNVLLDKLALSVAITKDKAYDELLFVTQQDLSLKVRWIPSRPAGLPEPVFPPQYPNSSAVFPWLSPVIPSAYVNGTLSSGLPNGDRYDKFQSVQGSILFYLGLDTNTISPKDPKLSIFLTNLEDRGIDNYRKKVYMTALTSGMMEKYSEKINSFLNEVYSSFTTYGRPVLSSFKTSLVKFFLSMHVGYDEYPDYVVEYFTMFVDIIGFGDPSRRGRDDAVMFGERNIVAVRQYFAARNVLIQSQKDQSSIIYHWHLAGLDPEGLVMEAVHNIAAFSQYNNVLFLLVQDKVRGTPIPQSNNTISYDFFSRYGNATNDTDRLNVVREVYRLLVPNNAMFSRVKEKNPTNPNVVVQSRHVHKAIMISAANATFHNPLAYFAYNTAQYAQYDTDFSDLHCPVSPPPPSSVRPYMPKEQFTVSPVDNETLLDLCNTKMMPVYPMPIYAPFGLGYRRCAGEVLNYFFTMKMLDKLRDLSFFFGPTRPGIPFVTLAPFTAVPDNIYVV